MEPLLDRPQKPKRRRRPPASEITPDTLIWCPWCQQEHPASAFNKESRRFSGLAGICRLAQADKRQLPEEQAKSKQRNKRRWADPVYREKSLAASAARRKTHGLSDLRRARARLQSIVDAWKEQGCIDCGYQDIRAIDPDHVDSDSKVHRVSRLVQLCASAQRIRDELEKCVPRCARCHRRRTHQQRFARIRLADRVPPSWRRRLEMQDANDVIKLSYGCADCGWNGWARGLDWDHVRGIKVSTIAIMIARLDPWEDVLVEMAKCEVVCANCHRIRTRTRREYRRRS
jgi:hypothetical protein